MKKSNFDVVVVGAGSGGLTSAVGFAKVGKRVLLVEREHLGGECTNSGCIPSKALLHHAKAYHTAVSISGVNEQTENFRQAALVYVRGKINGILEHETPEHFKSLGIEVVMGEAIFTSPRSIAVNDSEYAFNTAIIATGSSPRMIEITGLDPAYILTNQNLFTLDSIPARTLIVGAGPIGLEMGQALSMLGSTVTILDNSPTFARLEDTAIQPIIKKAFTDLSITIVQNATISHVEQNVAYVTQTGTDDVLTVPFDNVLVAIGRVPNIPNGLEVAEITATTSGISVNHNYQTTNKRVYAVGDVADTFKFTHVADNAARGVVAHVVSHGLLSIKPTSIPKVTYTSPEIAQIGLSQSEAEAKYGAHNIHRIEVPFSTNDRAITDNDTEGILVVLVRRLSGKIIGAHIVGPRAGEILAVFSVAIDNNISLWKLRRTIFAYPTYSLIIKKAGDVFFATQIKTLKEDVLRKTITLLPKLLILTVWFLGLYYLYSYTQTNNLSAETLTLRLFDFMTQTAWGPLLYILAYTIRPITFLPGTALTILSGVFFGLWAGVIYTIIGANMSATLAYFIGRFFGGKNQSQRIGIFGRFATACRETPFISVLTMRLLFFPYDAVNYGAGLLKIPFVPYIVATIVGTLIGIATFVAIGASVSIEEFTQNGLSVDVIDSTFLLTSALLFVVSIAVAKYLKK